MVLLPIAVFGQFNEEDDVDEGISGLISYPSKDGTFYKTHELAINGNKEINIDSCVIIVLQISKEDVVVSAISISRKSRQSAENIVGVALKGKDDDKRTICLQTVNSYVEYDKGGVYFASLSGIRAKKEELANIVSFGVKKVELVYSDGGDDGKEIPIYVEMKGTEDQFRYLRDQISELNKRLNR